MSKAVELHAATNPNRQTSADSIGEDLRERIQKRAYELYQARGATPGHALDDWTRAKSEILDQTTIHRAAA